MNMHICPLCGKNNTVVSDDGKKGFCISCGQPFTIEEQNEKAWNEGLDDREQYWCQDLLKVAPVSLALSYQQLFEYIKEGNIGCTLFLIRDVYELFMKIPVIVLFNGVYSVIENKKDITEFLEQHPRFAKVYRSSAQVFTSGKWMEAVRNGAALEQKTDTDVFDKDEDQLYIETVNYLASIEKEFNFLDPKKGCSNKGEPLKMSNMSEWRNRALGHGCLARDPEESYQEIPYILKMFKGIGELSFEYYNNVSFKCGHVRLRGVDTIPNIKGKVSIVCGGPGKEKEYNIHDFVMAQEKNLAYYDGYNRGKAFLLDYGDGNRYKDKSLTEFLQKHLNALKTNSAFTLSSESAEADNLEEADIRELEERLSHHDSIVYLDSLYEWLENAMNSCDKGLLLLQMERGMGKTTFCETLDQLSDADIVREHSTELSGWAKFMANTVIRVWHFNSTYRGRPEVYIDGIKNALLTVQNDKKNNRLTGTLNEAWDGLLHCEKELRHIQFAEALNQTAEAQMRSSSRGKVLLVLDGIDEITDLKTLREYLPKQNELAPNVYILLTCRTDEEIVDQQNNFVQQNTFASRLIYTRNAVQENLVMKTGINTEYQEAVKQYLEEALPVKLTEKEIVQIVKHFDYRFSDIAAYKDLCQVSPVFQKLESTSLIDQFMKEVEANAPEIYKNKMERILQCLTWTGSELSLREIAYFVGEGYVSYQLIGMMDELRAFVRVVRTERGNCYEISHESWRTEIVRLYPCGGISFRSKCNSLLEEIDSMQDEEKIHVFFDDRGFEGERWLVTNIIKIFLKSFGDFTENWYEDIRVNIVESILHSYLELLCLINEDLKKSNDIYRSNFSPELEYIIKFGEIFSDYITLRNAYYALISTDRNEGQLCVNDKSYRELMIKFTEIATLAINEAKEHKSGDLFLLAIACENFAVLLHYDNYALHHSQIVNMLEHSINISADLLENKISEKDTMDLYKHYSFLFSTMYSYNNWMNDWGDVTICQQSLERALPFLEQVLLLMENKAITDTTLVYYVAHVYLFYGVNFVQERLKMKYYEKVVEIADELLKKMPNEEIYMSLKCSAYASIARHFETEARYKEAESYWKELIDRYRNQLNFMQYRDLLVSLGDNYMQQGKYRDAIKYYESSFNDLDDYKSSDFTSELTYHEKNPEYVLKNLLRAYDMVGSSKKELYEWVLEQYSNGNQEVYVILKNGFPDLLPKIPPAIVEIITSAANPDHEFEYSSNLPFSAQQGNMLMTTKEILKNLQNMFFSVYGENIFGEDEEKKLRKKKKQIQKDRVNFFYYIQRQRVKKSNNWEYRLKTDKTLSQGFFEELETVLCNFPRSIVQEIPVGVLKVISTRNRGDVAFIFRNRGEYNFRKSIISSKIRLNPEVLCCTKYLIDKYVKRDIIKIERQTVGKD